MKMKIGVGVAVLSALAAEGKDFNREELNAMLDKLAASPEPKVRRGPQATCYSVAMPRPEVFEYVCKKCGAHTVYQKNTLRIGNVLARYREEAANLRALGLDIVLDESVLCSKCRSAKELNIVTSGVILNAKAGQSFRAGEPVAIMQYGHDRCRVSQLVQHPDYWISAQYISDKGEVLGDGVNIRSKPLYLGKVVTKVDKGIVLKRLPAKEGDPKEWVRIEPLPIWKMKEDADWEMDYGILVATKDIGGFSCDEAEGAAPARFDRLAWVINGKRTIVRTYDARILKAFLTGKTIWKRECDEEVSVKNALPRLRELLGDANGKERRYSVSDRVADILAKKPQLKDGAGRAGGKLRILVFKNERMVELHAPGWKEPRKYPMTAFSGTLGPKLREGDGQIPEGVYGIECLNPNSSYYLSLKVSYPNAADRARAKKDGRTKLGGDIMIHGSNATIGCVPIGDDAIEDVFYLANAVGIKNVSVVIAPYDMRKGCRPELEKSPLAWYPELCGEIETALCRKDS